MLDTEFIKHEQKYEDRARWLIDHQYVASGKSISDLAYEIYLKEKDEKSKNSCE